MRIPFLVAAALAASLAAAPAQAEICFGSQTRLDFVQKLPIRSPENKPLHLARLLQVECMGLPYSITDAGYVLAVEDEQTHFPLSEGQIASFQSSRALPTPLPDYEMSTSDWIGGHLLWGALLPVLLALGAIGWLIRPQSRPEPRQPQRRPAKRPPPRAAGR